MLVWTCRDQPKFNPYYLLNPSVGRSVLGPEAELWVVWYHFGFVYSCPVIKTLVRSISFTLSKMRRERRMQIFGAFGPDFKFSNTFFKMCAKICQAATRREIIITIEKIWVFSVGLQFDKKMACWIFWIPGNAGRVPLVVNIILLA